MGGRRPLTDEVTRAVHVWLGKWPELLVGWSFVGLLAGVALRFGWPVTAGSGPGERALRVANVLLLVGLPSVLYAVVVVPALFIDFARVHRALGCLVIVGLAILVLFGLCWGASWAHMQARQPACAGNLHSIGLAVRMYCDDHAEAFPDSPGPLRAYFRGGEPPKCPDAEAAGDSGPNGGYEYVGAGLRLADIKRPGAVPLVFDDTSRHSDGRFVGFADGTVSWMQERDFRQALAGAVGARAYPPKTVEALKKQEPWLNAEGRGVP